MKEFKDKVAVITGAGSGIGRGLAERCVKEGMKVVLAEINERRLKTIEKKLRKLGAKSILSIKTDVSKPDDIKNLATQTIDRFGAVHLLFNNAGVSNSKYTWNYTIKDWQWQLGVNLFGVAYGINAFAPFMMKQDFESIIINTSSVEGLFFGGGPGGAIYDASKNAIVSISETLKRELEQVNPPTKLKVSVLCPGWISTKIFNINSGRPLELQNNPEEEIEDGKIQDTIGKFKGSLESAHLPIPAEECADIVFNAIQNEEFYILTHNEPDFKNQIEQRFEGILKAFENLNNREKKSDNYGV